MSRSPLALHERPNSRQNKVIQSNRTFEFNKQVSTRAGNLSCFEGVFPAPSRCLLLLTQDQHGTSQNWAFYLSLLFFDEFILCWFIDLRPGLPCSNPSTARDSSEILVLVWFIDLHGWPRARCDRDIEEICMPLAEVLQMSVTLIFFSLLNDHF